MRPPVWLSFDAKRCRLFHAPPLEREATASEVWGYQRGFLRLPSRQLGSRRREHFARPIVPPRMSATSQRRDGEPFRPWASPWELRGAGLPRQETRSGVGVDGLFLSQPRGSGRRDRTDTRRFDQTSLYWMTPNMANDTPADGNPDDIRWLTALPVYNEVERVNCVLDEVVRYSPNVLVVDDGSTDKTTDKLSRRDDVQIVAHQENLGYGAALKSAFEYAVDHGYDVLVTIDCDGQHEPQRIPMFVSACRDVDIVSGSRYLKRFSGDSQPPAQRRWVNQLITKELNQKLGMSLTDAFCGFKAYRVEALQQLELNEPGYAMPLELWIQAAKVSLCVVELPVPLIYLDDERSFGGALDDAQLRLEYYRQVIARSMALAADELAKLEKQCGETA